MVGAGQYIIRRPLAQVRYPNSYPRERWWGKGGDSGGGPGGGGPPPTFTDPDGLDWFAAWDFSQGDVDAQTAIPALAGPVDLPLTSGSYTRATYPDYYDPTGLDLDSGNAGPLDTAVNSNFQVNLPGLNTGDEALHVRMILEVNASTRFQLVAGGAFGAAERHLLVQDSAVPTSENRILS